MSYNFRYLTDQQTEKLPLQLQLDPRPTDLQEDPVYVPNAVPADCGD